MPNTWTARTVNNNKNVNRNQTLIRDLNELILLNKELIETTNRVKKKTICTIQIKHEIGSRKITQYRFLPQLVDNVTYIYIYITRYCSLARRSIY